MKAKISIITLATTDFAKMKKFYTDLGFTVSFTGEGKDYVTFKMEGTILALFPRKDLAEDIGIPADGLGFSGVTLAHNVASKEKVDETLKEAVAAGGTLVKEGSDVFWGGYSGYFRDPEGYLWEVAFNPFEDLT